MAFQRVAAVQLHMTFRPSPDVVAQRIGAEVVLVNLQTNQIYELNRTGARLWELVTAGHDRGELQQQLQAEFDVDEAALTAEIDAFLTALEREQLVTVLEAVPDERE